MRRRRVLHVSKELGYWTALLGEQEGIIFNRPLDPKRDKFADAGHLQLTLSARVTEQLLTNAPAVFHGRINDVAIDWSWPCRRGVRRHWGWAKSGT